jgi:hypothetical protein
LQLLIKVNKPPRSGICAPTSREGQALSTILCVACFHWVDDDGNYPLTYQFVAYRRGW